LFSDAINKQATNGQKDDQPRDLQNMCSFCARTVANWIHVFAKWQHFGTLKIKTLITHLCSLIISDSVAVEIFAIGQPCAKIFRKV